MPAATAPTPRNRRERPAKPALTREGIIDAAVSIFRTEGLGRVTMRSVAAALDTGHASLYVYVRDTDDLRAQILDAELAAVRMPAAGVPWRTGLIELLLDYRRVLGSHVEIAKTALSTRLDGPHYLDLVEAVVELLAQGGITGRAAAWGVDVLMQYPAAIAAEHAGEDIAAPDHRATGELVGLSSRPRLAALAGELFSGTPLARTTWGLNVLIDGLLAAAADSNEKKI